MKKYVIVRVYESLSPSIVWSTDNLDDAKAYATIMNRNEGFPYEVLTRVNYAEA
jgi:hypothetical protein